MNRFEQAYNELCDDAEALDDILNSSAFNSNNPQHIYTYTRANVDFLAAAIGRIANALVDLEKELIERGAIKDADIDATTVVQ